jgi:undecaprenyl pyrophosphate phosphatase UppP
MVTMAIHLGALVAVLSVYKNRLQRISREGRQINSSRKRRRRHVDKLAITDFRILKVAAIPVIISVFFYNRTWNLIQSMFGLSLMLLLNGFIMFILSRMPQGNKDSRNMSSLDGITIGIGSALGILPGFSRVGGGISFALLRGTHRERAIDIALILSIPALVIMLITDVFAVIALKASIQFIGMLVYLVMATLSFLCSYLSIMIMRYLSLKTNYSSFAYYSWGGALFSFILYLMIS